MNKRMEAKIRAWLDEEGFIFDKNLSNMNEANTGDVFLAPCNNWEENDANKLLSPCKVENALKIKESTFLDKVSLFYVYLWKDKKSGNANTIVMNTVTPELLISKEGYNKVLSSRLFSGDPYEDEEDPAYHIDQRFTNKRFQELKNYYYKYKDSLKGRLTDFKKEVNDKLFILNSNDYKKLLKENGFSPVTRTYYFKEMNWWMTKNVSDDVRFIAAFNISSMETMVGERNCYRLNYSLLYSLRTIENEYSLWWTDNCGGYSANEFRYMPGFGVPKIPKEITPKFLNYLIKEPAKDRSIKALIEKAQSVMKNLDEAFIEEELVYND